MTHHRQASHLDPSIDPWLRPNRALPTDMPELTPAREARVDRLGRALAALPNPDHAAVPWEVEPHPRRSALLAAGERIYEQQRVEVVDAALGRLILRRSRLEAAIAYWWCRALTVHVLLTHDSDVDRRMVGDLRRLAGMLAAHDRVLRAIAELEQTRPTR